MSAAVVTEGAGYATAARGIEARASAVMPSTSSRALDLEVVDAHLPAHSIDIAACNRVAW